MPHTPIAFTPAVSTLTQPAPTTIDHPIISTLRAMELEVLTSYTLADAMREGAKASKKKTGGWIDGESSCALGAAFLAASARDWI